MKLHQHSILIFACATMLFSCRSDDAKLRTAGDAGDINLVSNLVEKGADVNSGISWVRIFLQHLFPSGRHFCSCKLRNGNLSSMSLKNGIESKVRLDTPSISPELSSDLVLPTDGV